MIVAQEEAGGAETDTSDDVDAGIAAEAANRIGEPSWNAGTTTRPLQGKAPVKINTTLCMQKAPNWPLNREQLRVDLESRRDIAERRISYAGCGHAWARPTADGAADAHGTNVAT